MVTGLKRLREELDTRCCRLLVTSMEDALTTVMVVWFCCCTIVLPRSIAYVVFRVHFFGIRS